jgi:hypothetical protein
VVSVDEDDYLEVVRRVGVRLPDRLWTRIQRYADHGKLVRSDGAVDISEAVRDLLGRGLDGDRSAEAGYRSGYDAGRLAAYREIMLRVAGVPPRSGGSR